MVQAEETETKARYSDMTAAHRPVVMSDAGMVTAGHPAAAVAGAEMLRRGGNAVDAAVASAAALAVAIPHMNGLGGDVIALVYEAASGRVTTVNGSGAAPAAASVAHYRSLGHESIPRRGPLSMSVPGVVRGWADCLERWGTRPLAECLEFAIVIAETGVALDQGHVDFFGEEVYAELAAESPALARTFVEPGRHPLGRRLKQPLLAQTLRALAAEGADSFYRGGVARALVADLREQGALLAAADLAQHRTLFQESLSTRFRGRDVHVAPPNSQGLALTLLLGLTEHQPPERRGGRFEPGAFLPLKRTAFELRDAYACDPARSRLPDDLLTEAALRALAQRADTSEARTEGGGGDTSTLVVIDAKGNAVSWVQSLFEPFGSGVVSESTGVVLHNRLHLERLDDDPVHGLAPGVRPFHTLCPALVVADGRCEMSIATPGDHGQPQTLYQVLRHVYEEELSIQAAIERPRIRHDTGSEVMLEDRVPQAWWRAIEAAGYVPAPLGPWSPKMGGVNAVRHMPDGLLMAGADPRRSSYAVPSGL